MEPVQATVVREIFEWFCSGVGCSQAAKRLKERGEPAFGGGPWHPLTVRRILRNESYTGRTICRRTKAVQNGGRKRTVVWRSEDEWIEVPGVTPALIPKDLFLRAQAILDDPARQQRGKPSINYRLRGHVRCLACGTPMVGQVLQAEAINIPRRAGPAGVLVVYVAAPCSTDTAWC